MNIYRHKHAIVVWILILLYMIALNIACHSRYITYGYDDFDLAVHAQSTWNILHGSLYCSIIGIPFPGNHMALILFLVAPLYAVFTSPLLLLYLQTTALAAGAWGIFLTARMKLSPAWAVLMSTAYLVYPPLIYMNLYEFHPVALATCFLIYAWYFYESRRFPWFVLFLCLAVLCQENIALVAFGFGVLAIFQRRKIWTWTLLPAGAGMAFFVLAAGFIMPALNNKIQFLRIYAHLGGSPGEILMNILLHPVNTLRVMTHPAKLEFLNSLLAPIAYMSLAAPSAFIPATPVLAQRLLSGRASEALLVFHYQAEFIPFIFAAGINGISNILKIRRNTVKYSAALLIAVFSVASLISTGAAERISHEFKHVLNRPAALYTADRAIEQIPPGASVVATFSFLDRLSCRRNLHSLHHIYYGKYTLSDVRYPVPRDIDFLVMDVHDRIIFTSRTFAEPNGYRNLQQILGNDEQWRVSAQLDGFLVLERTAFPRKGPPDLLTRADPDSFMSTNVVLLTEDITNICLRGFALEQPDKENNAPLTLFWEKKKNRAEDYDAFITIHGNRLLYADRIAPGSRIWPPQSWPVETLMADKHRIHLLTRPSLENPRMEVRLRKIK